MSSLSRIHFMINESSRLLCWVLLIPYLYSHCWLDQMVVGNRRNQFLTYICSGCRLNGLLYDISRSMRIHALRFVWSSLYQYSDILTAFNTSLSRVRQCRFSIHILFSLHDTQSRASEHVVSVRGATTPVLTIRQLKAALSPLDIHSVNRPNLIFSMWDMGITIIHKRQSEKWGSKHWSLN